MECKNILCVTKHSCPNLLQAFALLAGDLLCLKYLEGPRFLELVR